MPTFPVPSRPAGRDERRRSDRRPYVVEAWLASPTAKDADERIEAVAVNVSRHGVAFDAAVELPVDAYYALELGMGPQRLVSEVQIVSCTRREDGTYHVGAEFC